MLALACHREAAPSADVGGSPADGCHDFMEQAIHDINRWQLETATARAVAAVDDCPNNAHPYVVLGAVRWATGDVAESTALFERALGINPVDFGGVLALARNLTAQGRLADASRLTQTLVMAEREQPTPLLTMMRIDYLRCDASRVAWSAEAVRPLLDEYGLEPVGARAAWAAALRDRGPLCVVNGESTEVAMDLSRSGELAFVDAVVGDRATRATLEGMLPESWIAASLVERLGLKPLAQLDMPPFAEFGFVGETQVLVPLPTIRIGEFTFENVPALVDPYPTESGVELALGYQVLHRIGAVTRDHPRRRLILDRVAPEPGPDDLDLVMAPYDAWLAPLVRIELNGGKQSFAAHVGGLDPEDFTILTARDGPPAAPFGRLRFVELGGLTLTSPAARLVSGNKGDANRLLGMSQATAVDVRASINMPLLHRHRVTYSFAAGRMSIAAR